MRWGSSPNGLGVSSLTWPYCMGLTCQKQAFLERMFWHLLIKVARSIDVTQDALSTLLFSFASLGLRLREPAKPTGPTESGYPQGHRMHETGRSLGADWHIERGSGWFYPQVLHSYAHIINRIIHRCKRAGWAFWFSWYLTEPCILEESIYALLIRSVRGESDWFYFHLNHDENRLEVGLFYLQ